MENFCLWIEFCLWAEFLSVDRISVFQEIGGKKGVKKEGVVGKEDSQETLQKVWGH